MDKDCIYARKKIIERAKAEMLGPGSEDIGGDVRVEVISDSPVDRYSLGILFPQNLIYGQDDNEKQKKMDDNEEEIVDEEDDESYENKKINNDYSKSSAEDETIDEEISMTNQSMPSAMGLTCFVKGKAEKVVVELRCAKYRASLFKDCAVKINNNVDVNEYLIGEYVYVEDGYLKLKKNITKKIVYELVNGRKIGDERPDIVIALYKLATLCTSEESPRHTGYVRVPFLEKKKIEIAVNKELSNVYITEDGKIDSQSGCLKITILTKHYGNDISSYTIVMINEYKSECRYNKCFFQPEIRVKSKDNDFVFIEKSEVDRKYNKYMEDSELIFNLLYRNKKSYAVGHGTATGQNVDNDSGIGEVFTDFFPSFEIPQLDFAIENLGYESTEILSMFNMSDISDIEKDTKIELLNKFADAYKQWIDEQKEYGNTLKSRYGPRIIDDLLNQCEESLNRIQNGIYVLQNELA